MRFWRHRVPTVRQDALRRLAERPDPSGDSGGAGAEYIDHQGDRRQNDDDEDRTAWSRARHWTPEQPKH